MSISGSQEAKTAKLAMNDVQNSTESQAIDAQEDREIVGVNISSDGPVGGDAAIEGEVRVGSANLSGSAAEGAQDNLNFSLSHRFKQNSDTTNGVGHQSGVNRTEWFGEGSGIEWNEDATLTASFTENGGNPVDIAVEVYYREL